MIDSDKICGYQPNDTRYAPCIRGKGHDGPCAHHSLLVNTSLQAELEENERIFSEGLEQHSKDLQELAKLYQPHYNTLSFLWGVLVGVGLGVLLIVLIKGH